MGPFLPFGGELPMKVQPRCRQSVAQARYAAVRHDGTVAHAGHLGVGAGVYGGQGMRSILLWLIGVPIPLILLLAFCTHHL